MAWSRTLSFYASRAAFSACVAIVSYMATLMSSVGQAYQETSSDEDSAPDEEPAPKQGSTTEPDKVLTLKADMQRELGIENLNDRSHGSFPKSLQDVARFLTVR